MNWDEWDASRVDDEVTQLTEFARKFAIRSAEMAVAAGDIPDFAYAEGGAVTRFLVPGRYVTEVRGQASATAHGHQGANPERIAWLRQLRAEEGLPVRIIFVDQRNEIQQEQHWQEVWLDRIEPEVRNIQMADKTRKRQGWKVRELRQGTGLIEFPPEAPEPVDLTPQGALL